MENQRLNTIVDEINAFIKTKMGLLLNDLLVQSNEYEETKQQILGLPFVKQIIKEITEKQLFISKNDEIIVDALDLNLDLDLESITEDISDDIKHIFLKMNDDVKDEHIFLKIEETVFIKSEPVLDLDLDNEVEIIENPHLKITETIEVTDDDDNKTEIDSEIDASETNSDDHDSETESETTEVDDIPVTTTKEVEKEEESEEDDNDESSTSVAEEEEEGVFEIEINGTSYFTDNEKSGLIYKIDENGDPGDEVGVFKNGKPIFH
jgi:hypothetical protein